METGEKEQDEGGRGGEQLPLAFSQSLVQMGDAGALRRRVEAAGGL